MNTEVKIYTHSEINKRILAKGKEERPPEDLPGLFDKYNDELYEIYNKKKQQFLETSRQYNKSNQETLYCNEKRLHKDYQKKLDTSYFTNWNEIVTDRRPEFPEGKLIRARTERLIHSVPGMKEVDCSLESWFKRQRILNKFIWAARTIILKRRLEICLGKLKGLDEEDIRRFKSMKPFVHNISYADIFEKYL